MDNKKTYEVEDKQKLQGKNYIIIYSKDVITDGAASISSEVFGMPEDVFMKIVELKKEGASKFSVYQEVKIKVQVG